MQFNTQKFLEKQDKQHKKKSYIYEIINGIKTKKKRPIYYLDMIIKDYLELNYFNWIHIKKNQNLYLHDHQKLKECIDQSDMDEAKKDNDITHAHHVIYDHQQQIKVIKQNQIYKIKT